MMMPFRPISPIASAGLAACALLLAVVAVRGRRRPQKRAAAAATMPVEEPPLPSVKEHGMGAESVVPIGEVLSVFESKRGVPRQGSLAPGAVANIRLFKERVGGETLDGLASFSHVWVIFLFSRNSNEEGVEQWRSRKKNLFKAKVRPPLLGGKKVGVFSTRSPHRPNPIGMTLAKIEQVDVAKGSIFISGIDLCNHTPVIDIKPYVPADLPEQPTFAPWVVEAVNYHVNFSKEAENQIQLFGRGQQFYSDVESLRKAISDILALDVRGIGQGRGTSEPDIDHKIVVDGRSVRFCFLADKIIMVKEVS